MMHGLGLRLTGLLMALVMAGCAGNRNGEDDRPAQVLRVTIQNDGAITQQPRISLVPVAGGGLTILVGRLTTLGTESLTIRRPDLGGNYQLQARATGGGTIASPVFLTRGDEEIFWDLRRNLVSVRRLSADGDPAQ